MIVLILTLLALEMIPAALSWRTTEWCLERRDLRSAVLPVLAVLGVGTAYGLLRLTGAVILPGDNTYSFNFFDASWRDDGVRLLLIWGAPFAGTAFALIRRRRKCLPLDSQPEEKS